MTEYIDKKAAVGILEAISKNSDCRAVEEKLKAAAKRIGCISAADVAPVRCKDCEHSYKVLDDLYCGNDFCRVNIFSDVEVPPDFYCAEGKKRKDTIT